MTTRPQRRGARHPVYRQIVQEAPAAGVAVDNRRSFWLLTGGLAVLASVLWALAFARAEVPIAGIDAEDYAQIGRQIASGQGFSTLFLPLNGLAWLKDHGSMVPPWPNISRFPLPPLVMALVFKLIGASDLGIAVFSLLGYLAGIPFVILLGNRLGGRPLAVLAGMLYVVHPDALQLSISGLTENMSAAVLLATTWLAFRSDVRSHAIAGALFGLSYWNRNTLLLLAIPAAFVIWKYAADRKRSLTFFAGAAALVTLPWVIWTFFLTGDPIFNLQSATVVPFGTLAASPDFPWYNFVYRPVPPGGFPALMSKWVSQAFGLYDLLPETLGPLYLLALAIVGLVVVPKQHRPMRWMFLALLGLQIAIYSFAGNISRFYTVFLPFIELFAGVGLFWLSSRYLGSVPKQLPAGLLVLLVSLPTIGAITGIRPFEGSPTRNDPVSAIVDVSLENGPYVASRTVPNQVVLSNVPWSVAWRAARPSAPLPPRPTDLADFEASTGLKVSALYLTPQMYIVGVPAGWREWNILRDGLFRDQAQPPDGFIVDRKFRNGSVLLVRPGT